MNVTRRVHPPRFSPRREALNTPVVWFALVALSWWLGLPASAQDSFVYFGTFTNAASRGIYVSRLEAKSGRLSEPELAATINSPNFLALSPGGQFLYAVTRGDPAQGGVAAFAREPRSGKLTFLGEQPASGAGPCHVSVDPTGQSVLIANYSGGSVKSFRTQADGALADGTMVPHQGRSVHPSRQQEPHAHCIVPAPAGRFALACDLGTDQVLVYRLNPTNAALTAHEPPFATVPPGSGPRQLAFSPDGKSAYVINELTCTVTAFGWDGQAGTLTARETVSLLPPGVALTNTFSAAAIGVRPDGKFTYGTVRGHDSVSVLAVDAKTGRLSLVESVPCGGKVPRGMGLDPTGRWLIVAHQKSDTVTVFRVEAATGRLVPTGQTLAVGAPVDVKFAPVP